MGYAKRSVFVKKLQKKCPKNGVPSSQKKTLFGKFFGPEILQNRGSCVGVEPLSIKGHENEVKFRVLRNPRFSPII
jgi:hypothetical protein